jgi:hypothetical protein
MGSAPSPKTMGIVVVAAFAARTAATLPDATRTATPRLGRQPSPEAPPGELQLLSYGLGRPNQGGAAAAPPVARATSARTRVSICHISTPGVGRCLDEARRERRDSFVGKDRCGADAEKQGRQEKEECGSAHRIPRRGTQQELS